MLGLGSERQQQHQHRCSLKRCGHTADRSSSRGRTRRQLASEGVARGCLRPAAPFLRGESPPAQAKATNKCAPLTRGRKLDATSQRRGPSVSLSYSPRAARPCKTESVSPSRPVARAQSSGTPPMLDLCFVSKGADNECSSSTKQSELSIGETTAADAGCPSPTNNELTDAALLKSQWLLRQFSSLDLDSDPDATHNRGCEDSMSEISFRSLSPKRLLSAKSSRPEDDDGTVKVPKEFMKMMAEMWDEIRVLKASQKPEDLTSSRSTTAPRKSGCSVASFTSTAASTRSDSHSSRSSPRRESYFPTPLPPPSTPRPMSAATSPRPATVAPTLATPRQCAASVRPCAAASYCVPASSAIHVCVPPITPRARMAVTHMRAASQTPPCRSISMVQTVTVTTSWMVS